MIRLLFVAALGYLLGTLYAPRKGATIREAIRKKFDELRDDMTERSASAKAELSEGLSRASESLAQAGEIASEAVGRLDKDVHDIAKKGKDILSPKN